MLQKLKQSKSGFTLVELIVVIAILAILAGVAVPVYNGYIKKANQAGDLQLLAALNTAYAAACTEMGLDTRQVVGSATLSGEDGNKTLEGISTVGSGVAQLSAGGKTGSAALYDAFLRYYGDNINTPFKVYTSLGYDMANGVFVDGSTIFSYTTALGTVAVTAAQVNAFQASTFGNLEGGVSELMEEVDRVIEAASYAGVDGSILAWNHTKSKPNPQKEAIYAYLSDLGYTNEEIGTMSAENVANALVLMAAYGTSEYDADSAVAQFLVDGSMPALTSTGNTEVDNIANMAFTYAVITGFAKSDYATQEQKDAFNNAQLRHMGDVMNLLSNVAYNGTTNQASESFTQYMTSQGAADIKGYMSTMEMINSNIDHVNFREVISNGFTDTALVEMLSTILD